MGFRGKVQVFISSLSQCDGNARFQVEKDIATSKMLKKYSKTSLVLLIHFLHLALEKLSHLPPS